MTSKASAYYEIVSRMRKAGLPFTSAIPGADSTDCALVISSAEEAGQFGGRALALEDLDGNSGVFKGQVLSKLNGGCDVILVGVDPGTRIGLAVFYGETSLEYGTFGSAAGLSRRIGAFVRGVPAKRFVVRVGNGRPSMAARLIQLLKLEVQDATIEMVDESGTSVRRLGMKGIKGDEGAAARIAFRKGEIINP